MIEHSGGSLITRCVTFAEEQISGLQLVERSGVEYQAQSFGSMGSAMCQLDREPSTVPPGCFGSGPYWQYFHRQGSGWQASLVGASSSVLHDGDMDGWRYAAGSSAGPAAVTFQAACGALAPAVSPTHPAVATNPVRPPPLPAASATPSPAPATSLEALAPSASPTRAAVLASTGPPPQPPNAIGPWLAFGGAAILLLGLGAVNLLRRGP